MAIKFMTEEWIKALMEEVNNSRGYREAARSWEGDFYFIIEPGDTGAESVIYYMEIGRASCRERV